MQLRAQNTVTLRLSYNRELFSTLKKSDFEQLLTELGYSDLLPKMTKDPFNWLTLFLQEYGKLKAYDINHKEDGNILSWNTDEIDWAVADKLPKKLAEFGFEFELIYIRYFGEEVWSYSNTLWENKVKRKNYEFIDSKELVRYQELEESNKRLTSLLGGEPTKNWNWKTIQAIFGLEDSK
jgi:hypothetical protein